MSAFFVRNIQFQFFRVNLIAFAARELSGDFDDTILFILLLS